MRRERALSRTRWIVRVLRCERWDDDIDDEDSFSSEQRWVYSGLATIFVPPADSKMGKAVIVCLTLTQAPTTKTFLKPQPGGAEGLLKAFLSYGVPDGACQHERRHGF